MSDESLRDRTIALAGIFQVAQLVHQIAHTGLADSAPVQSSIESLFKINAVSTEDVYNGVEGVSYGLRLMVKMLEGKNSRKDLEITRYLIGLIQLERQLYKRPKVMAQIGEAIERASGQVEHFSTTHPNVIASLADIYQSNVSALNPRIMVSGEPLHLDNPDNANKIRALLLAGIRSAVLWRQKGGNRWQVFFKRKHMIRTAQALLDDMQF